MSYNGSGTFNINTAGQPVVTGTVISSTAFNALTADLGTGLTTAITKDGQTATTARIPFAAGIDSTLTTDATSIATGSVITAGGVGIAKALWVGGLANIAGVLTTIAQTITSASANAFAVGRVGTTNPAFNIDASTALSATGVNIKSAAAAGGVAVSVLSSGANEALTVNAKGSGTIGIGSVSTGAVTITPATTISGATTLSSTLGVTGVATFAAGTAAAPAITTSGDTNTGIFFPAADTIAFGEGGAEAVRIDSSGNVGIGTASPGALLQVAGIIKSGVTGTNGHLQLARTSDGATITNFLTDGASGIINSVGATIVQVNAAEKMRIDSSGNVGIGTSSPGSRLQVTDSNGTAFVGGAIQNSNTNVGIGGLQFSSDPTYFKAAIGLLRSNSNGVGSLVFYNASSTGAADWSTSDERMRINSSGNVGIGTASPTAKLTIVETSDAPTADFYASGALVGTPCMFLKKQPNDGNTTQVYAQFLYNNATSGNGQINGNGSGAAAFGSYSDIRLKENVADLPSQLNNIMSLRPVEFDWKDGSGHQIGFIAQEVNEVYPDIVGKNSDGMLTLTDMNKNDARLIKAIQDLKSIIDAQATRIAALENK